MDCGTNSVGEGKGNRMCNFQFCLPSVQGQFFRGKSLDRRQGVNSAIFIFAYLLYRVNSLGANPFRGTGVNSAIFIFFHLLPTFQMGVNSLGANPFRGTGVNSAIFIFFHFLSTFQMGVNSLGANPFTYSRLLLLRSQRELLKYFEISVL